MQEQVAPTAAAKTNGGVSVDHPTDEIVIEKCRNARNAAKFSDLFDRGDVHAHHGGDDSAADLALLGILAHWTKDEAQLERLVSSSALGQREKWRHRDDYRKRTVRRALKDAGPGYDWSKEGGRERSRPIKSADEASGLADLPYIGKSTKSTGEERPALQLVRFAGRPTPAAREFVIPDLIPRYHPTTLYGWGGTAKSLIATLLA